VVRLAKALGVTCEVFTSCTDVLDDDGTPPPRKKKAKTPRGKRK
jgi:hypothetical protein